MIQKLEVGERRSLASHYTLTTVCTKFELKSFVRFCCMKGTNLILGGFIFQGAACGLIYRPMQSPRGRQDAASAAEKVRCPRSAILRNIIEEKRRRRTTSTGSLDGTLITKDNYVIKVDTFDSVSTSLQVIHEDIAETGPFTQHEVGELTLFE